MQHRVTRALAAAGFSVLFALTAACGGAAPEAKAPSADATGAPRVGSSGPDRHQTRRAPASTEAPKPTVAVVSAENGSTSSRVLGQQGARDQEVREELEEGRRQEEEGLSVQEPGRSSLAHFPLRRQGLPRRRAPKRFV